MNISKNKGVIYNKTNLFVILFIIALSIIFTQKLIKYINEPFTSPNASLDVFYRQEFKQETTPINKQTSCAAICNSKWGTSTPYLCRNGPIFVNDVIPQNPRSIYNVYPYSSSTSQYLNIYYNNGRPSIFTSNEKVQWRIIVISSTLNNYIATIAINNMYLTSTNMGTLSLTTDANTQEGMWEISLIRQGQHDGIYDGEYSIKNILYCVYLSASPNSFIIKGTGLVGLSNNVDGWYFHRE